ncbi:MAG: hypothetical protein LBT14_01735 [Treponema sp.]|jgi:hypothetical protein|nr:hypothetical protein [Treponema sp.]
MNRKNFLSILWYGDFHEELLVFKNQGSGVSLQVDFYPIFYYFASRILPGDSPSEDWSRPWLMGVNNSVPGRSKSGGL